MRTIARSIAVLAFLVASVALSGEASANHSWGTYHWARTSNPFTLTLADNMTTSEWKGLLTATSGDWNASASSVTFYNGTTVNASSNPLRTTVTPGVNAPRKCRPTLGRVEVCNASYGNNGWLGLAQIWLNSSGHIVQGTSKMNDTYFNTATYNIVTEKRHVVCQEVAHTFGLGHQSETGASLNTCMDYYHNTSASDTKSTTPNQHDFDQLAIIYSHLDSTTTVGAKAISGPALPVGGAGDDGTPQGASPAHGNWYAQDLGNGRTLLTHVYWAPDGH